MEVNKLEGKTLDVVSENVSVLAQAFPEVIVDGKVDFEKLRLILGEDIEDAEERYSFTWPGKREAIKLAISRTTGTLRPDKENSKDWDTTQNLFIEGDNLEVLRVLQNTYRGKVKMIYIDPPYNTGKDFVYKDDFKDNIANYKEQAGLEGQSNADTSGRYHTNWLNMMYPRLRLAKNLLRDDGVIFISIDDHEVHNLKKISDEIFGEENFVTSFIWEKKKKPSFLDANIGVLTEYLVCYVKNRSNTFPFSVDVTTAGKKYPLNNAGNSLGKLVFPPSSVVFNLQDCEIEPQDMSAGNIKTVLLNKISVKNGTNEGEFTLEGEWRYSQEKLNEILQDGDEITISQIPFRPNHVRKGGEIKKMKNIFSPHHYEMETNEDGSSQLTQLFGADLFDNPKPVKLIKTLIKAVTYSDESPIILDFFAGSATSGHAVMSLNAEEDGNRRFILVQLPEAAPNDSEARKAGFNSIPEISRERIRRAGEKIKADFSDRLKERTSPLDTGFKAFTLDTTNFHEWDTDTEDINASLLAALDTFKEGRTAEDALYEVLLKYGVDLTEPVEVLTLAGKQVYSLAGNYLLVCLEKQITLATVEEIAKLKPTRVVCYDDGFENDEVKQNALETLKRAGVEDVRVI